MTSASRTAPPAAAGSAGGDGAGQRRLQGFWRHLVTWLSLIWLAYQVVVTLGWIMPNAISHRAIHLAFSLVLLFLLYPGVGKSKERPVVFDIVLALVAVVVAGYTAYMQQFEQDLIIMRTGEIMPWEVVLGILAIGVIFIGTHRSMGAALPLVGSAALLYALFGHLLPGPLRIRHFGLDWILQYLYVSGSGIWGILLGVSAVDVFMFVLFASIFLMSGVGDMIMRVAIGKFGAYAGGPAKVAVVSSAFFGMFSGSAIANIVSTGSFSIPLMKRVGFRPAFAGAVEACASTGGMFTPPMMGTAAFVMAQYLGVPYGTVVLAAVAPALLFYVGVFCAVDFEAKKYGVQGLARDELPAVWPAVRRNWIMFTPLLLLLYLLVVGRYPPARAALWSIVAMLLLYMWINRRHLRFGAILEGLIQGTRGAVTVAAGIACIGIIIGVIELTGLGMKLSSALITLSGGSLLFLLVLTMIASLILGLGLTPTACYVTLAILVAPTLVEMGIPPLAAHFFVFLFGIISMLTPPVAMSAYVAATIAGAPMMTTGIQAFRIALPTFIVPFMFIYGPQLLGIGAWWQVLLAIITAVIGVISFTAGIQGWILAAARAWERLGLIGAALLMMKPGLATDVIGLGLLAAIMVIHRWRAQRPLPGPEPLGEGQPEVQ